MKKMKVGRESHAGPPLMPNDNVNFQRFRYSTKEEEHSEFVGGGFPDRLIQRPNRSWHPSR